MNLTSVSAHPRKPGVHGRAGTGLHKTWRIKDLADKERLYAQSGGFACSVYPVSRFGCCRQRSALRLSSQIGRASCRERVKISVVACISINTIRVTTLEKMFH